MPATMSMQGAAAVDPFNQIQGRHRRQNAGWPRSHRWSGSSAEEAGHDRCGRRDINCRCAHESFPYK